MSSLGSLLLHPVLTLSPRNNKGGVDVFYILTAFFAIGIWLVFKRYQRFVSGAVDFKVKEPDAAKLDYENIVIPNARLDSHKEDPRLNLGDPGVKYITCFDPSIGLYMDTFVADNAETITKKIEAAERAQESWKKTTFAERKRIVRSLKKWLVENQDVCARVACRDTGKTLIDAAFGEILTTCSKMEWLISHGEQVLRPEKRSSNLLLAFKHSEVHYDPLGVVSAIVSWNYPLHNAWSPILAAIFAGNAIVLKCSEHVVWSTDWFVNVIRHCLTACGYDDNLVQLVCCYPEEAEALTTSPAIKHITFIGSEAVGRKVAAAAAVNLTPVTMELGGKDPAIILPRTDLQKWSSVWMRGIYQNSGQNCIGLERLIVHSSQHDELYKILEERVRTLRPGPVLAQTQEGYIHTVDVGAMINGDRFDNLEQIIRDAHDAGAVVSEGQRYQHAYYEHGYYFRPSVVANANEEMDITREELFAPVALLIKYDTVDEAIRIANGTRFGLGASVFGPDQRDCKAVAKQLQCGMVSVNDFGVFYLNQDLPFGGTKGSGYGRFGGPEGLRSLTNPKVIVVDSWPLLAEGGIPKVLDYPVRSLNQSWEFVSGLVSFVYADGWRARIYGLVTLIRAARK